MRRLVKKVLSPQLIKKIKKLKADGKSIRLIANTLSLGIGTVFNALNSSTEGVCVQVKSTTHSKVPTLEHYKGEYPKKSDFKGRTFREIFCDNCTLGGYCRRGYDLTLNDLCCKYEEGKYVYPWEEL
jgi:hypothetical protein